MECLIETQHGLVEDSGFSIKMPELETSFATFQLIFMDD